MAADTGKGLIKVWHDPGRHKEVKMERLSCLLLIYFLNTLLLSCSVNRQISRQANKILVNDSVIRKGHIGICVYEPATGKYWYKHEAEKYFIPGSNTKLFTLYAGLKYLEDSLPGLRYYQQHDTIYVFPTGDPTFQHPYFKYQPVACFLEKTKSPIQFCNEKWQAGRFGKGWAWDDYNDGYMAERNAFPLHGNTMKVYFRHLKTLYPGDHTDNNFLQQLKVLEPDIPGISITYKIDTTLEKAIITRNISDNNLEVQFPDKDFSFEKNIPFVTNGISTAIKILQLSFPNILSPESPFNHLASGKKIIFSQSTDSVLKIMMHESDNFFAEQILLMAGNESLGYMNDGAMIHHLLEQDFRDLEQKPKWTDGSGLSRYNLFTPRSFIYVLEKMNIEFGFERLKTILPTGGEGTLKDYFISDRNYIYAKTGTLNNNSALSGYLITKKGKLLIFSILANNYTSGAAPVRSSFEHFLQYIRNKY